VNGADTPGVAVNTNDFNVTGHPAVSVPIGRDDAGVPFGMQVVAPRWRDGLALGVCAELETARPWPESADGYPAFPVP
jgi:amidase